MGIKERGKNTHTLAEAIKTNWNKSDQSNAERNGRPNASWNSLLVREGEKVNSRTGRQLFSCCVQKFLQYVRRLRFGIRFHFEPLRGVEGRQSAEQPDSRHAPQATHRTQNAKARQPDGNSFTATNQTFLSGKEISSKVQNGTIIHSVGARGLGNEERHS
jgi:hypothetical protein